MRPIPGVKVDYDPTSSWPWRARELDEHGRPKFGSLTTASTRLGLRYACWRIRVRQRRAQRMSDRGVL